jgi:hypothetical protein
MEKFTNTQKYFFWIIINGDVYKSDYFENIDDMFDSALDIEKYDMGKVFYSDEQSYIKYINGDYDNLLNDEAIKWRKYEAKKVKNNKFVKDDKK